MDLNTFTSAFELIALFAKKQGYDQLADALRLSKPIISLTSALDETMHEYIENKNTNHILRKQEYMNRLNQITEEARNQCFSFGESKSMQATNDLILKTLYRDVHILIQKIKKDHRRESFFGAITTCKIASRLEKVLDNANINAKNCLTVTTEKAERMETLAEFRNSSPL